VIFWRHEPKPTAFLRARGAIIGTSGALHPRWKIREISESRNAQPLSYETDSVVKEMHVRHWLSSSLALAVLVFALSYPVAVPAAPRTPQPKAAVAAQDRDREAHPEVRAALANLREAREHLQHSAHDFGGHRVAALKSVDEAIREAQICLKYDKR
jgi:hypothetical protein